MINSYMKMKAYGDNIIRMTYAAKEDFEKESLIVTAKPLPGAAPDIRTEIDENRNVSIFRNGKRLSSFFCPAFEAYDIYKSTGGAVEVRETVDGLRSSAKDGGKQFVRTSYHASCALDKIPLFVKAGAIIPTARPMQYVDEYPNEPNTVKVYPGANGYFLLYDDDGTTYRYEQGEYSRVEIVYHDNTRTVEANELQNGGYAKPLDVIIL